MDLCNNIFVQLAVMSLCVSENRSTPSEVCMLSLVYLSYYVSHEVV